MVTERCKQVHSQPFEVLDLAQAALALMLSQRYRRIPLLEPAAWLAPTLELERLPYSLGSRLHDFE